MFVVNITSFCNKSPLCSYCLNRKLISGSNRGEITVEDLKDIIERYNIKRGEQIGMSGGEPTTHSNISGILQYLLDRELTVVISTNLEEYNPHIEPHGDLYWQLSLHLFPQDKVDVRLNNIKRYAGAGHNINCVVIPVYHHNFDPSKLRTLSSDVYSLTPKTPLIFRYLEDTHNFRNELDPDALMHFVYGEIKNNYHPFAEVVSHIFHNEFVEGII